MNRIESIEFSQIENSTIEVKPFFDEKNLEIIKNVRVKLEVRISEAELTINELLNLGENSVVRLTRPILAPVDLLLEGKVVARGHLVAADDNFGIQITEIDMCGLGNHEI